jgi:hypothetical protein
MKECFENENLYILICSIIMILIIYIITAFESWRYIIVKKYKNSANTVIQDVITKKYYKAYSDYGSPIYRKKELTNYKLK